MFYLNDRVMMVHGYAQRTSNEWPGIGMSAPAWLSDYSNNLEVKSGGNVVRWMHVTPWKQDVESCDRVGLIEAMPAGDGEGDVKGERWNQRVALMRDAIIYNLKSATKPLNVLIAFTRPLITEFADNLNLKHPLLPTISPYPTMRLEAIRSIIPISCRRYPKSV